MKCKGKNMKNLYRTCKVWTTFLCLFFLIGFVSKAEAGQNWYRGCYFLPDPTNAGKLSNQPLYQKSRHWTPAKCSKKCFDEKQYSFAFLFNGYFCFCRKYLTRKAYESSCNQWCPGNGKFKCGGTKSVSAYSTAGPYITSVNMIVRPKKVIKNQLVKIIVTVELAADSFTKIGVKHYEQTSFRHVEATAHIDSQLNYEPKKKTRMILIKGRRGQIEFTHRYDMEGPKAIDVVVKNSISTMSARSFIQVGTRIPKKLEVWFTRHKVQPVCSPAAEDEWFAATASVFSGEAVTLQASVESGFNLTFKWDFCGVEFRNFSTHLENPDCINSVCNSDAQPYFFRTPGVCVINVEVSNAYGSTTESLEVKVITPEFRDFAIKALPLKWKVQNRNSVTPNLSPPVPPWAVSTPPISEGEIDDGRMGGSYANDYSNAYTPVNFYPFGDPPIPQSQPSEELEEQIPENHIELENGQYTKNCAIKFEASAFMTNIDDETVVEIKFGDGHLIQQKIEAYSFGLSERRRRKRSTQDSFQQIRAKRTVIRDQSIFLRQKRSTNDPVSNRENYLNNLSLFEPYNMREGSSPIPSDFARRAGGFHLGEGFVFDEDSSDQAVEVTYDKDCVVLLKFEHVYKTSGTFNVTAELSNGNDSLSAYIESGIEILDGTKELNIRCPDSAELGKSVILSVSTTTEIPDILAWKIFIKSDLEENWEEDENLLQSGYSYKKSFLTRGYYKIQVSAPTETLTATCVLRVEEVLSGVTAKVANKYVQTDTNAKIMVTVETGSSISFELVSRDGLFLNSTFQHEGKNKWSAYFNVAEAKCYKIRIKAANPVSNITSRPVEICGEEQISGFTVKIPEELNINNKIPITIQFESGTNVFLGVEVLSLTGGNIDSYHKTVKNATANRVFFMSKRLPEVGTYRVLAKANNHIPAKSFTCDKVPELTAKSEVIVAKIIPNNVKIELESHRVSRRKDSQPAQEWLQVFDAKLQGKLDDGAGVLYRWRLHTIEKVEEKLYQIHSIHHTSSPLFVVILPKCISHITSYDDVITKNDVTNSGQDFAALIGYCSVKVTIVSITNNASDFEAISKDTISVSQNLILPQTGVIETGKSCEFDIKCPSVGGDKCIVSFGDGSEPMKTSSNSNWNLLSHAYTEHGLYEITLSSSEKQNGKSTILNKTNIVVQDKISEIKLKGTDSLSYEKDPVGAWRVDVIGGSHKIYKWSVSFANKTNLYQEFTKEAEWGFTFPKSGNYLLEVVAFNEVSRQESSMRVTVLKTPWHFTVQSNNSILGRPSSFTVSTNASSNIVEVKFVKSGITEKYDLSCLKPNKSETDADKNIINSYVITHTYNQTGSYEATFSLLSKSNDDESKRLYTLKTDVLHKPAPKRLQLSIVEGKTNEEDGKHYIAISTKVVLRATTNFPTRLFTWTVWKIKGSTRDMLQSSPVGSSNSSVADFTYVIETQGIYEITALSYPHIEEASISIEAQQVIRKAHVDKPFSSKDRKFVNYCHLQRFPVNNTHRHQCDNLTLTAFCYGTKVTFYFYILFRPEVLDDYSKATKVVDIIKAISKQKIHGSGNEASIEYSFNRQGVYSLEVVASNKLGNQSAEIAEEKPTYGPSRPFLFYAQRRVARVSLSQKTYYAALNSLTTFDVSIQNTKQVVRVRWEMGDGTVMIGQTVKHSYRTPGVKTIHVVVENFVNSKTDSAEVKVEIPIEKVWLQDMPYAQSSESPVRLQAYVKPLHTAWNYTWYLRHDNKTEQVLYRNYIDHRFWQSGLYLVKVIAANKVSSAESEPIEVEIQQPIISKFIGETVITNKIANMSVDIITGSDVKVNWTINDSPVIATSFQVTHVFESVGIYTVKISLQNDLGRKVIEKQLFVVDKPCQLPGVKITRDDKVIKIARSKSLRIEADVRFDCSFLAKALYQWGAYFKRRNSYYDLDNLDSQVEYELQGVATNNRILELPPRTLPYGNYYISVNVSIEGSILYKKSKVEVNVSPSKLVAEIDGGNLRTITRSSNVTIDASRSHDPDYPEYNDSLRFQWKCLVLNSPNSPCFKSPNDEEIHEITERSAPSIEPTFDRDTHMRAANEYVTEPLNHKNEHLNFPDGVITNQSVLNFSASSLVQTADVFVFNIEVTKPGFPKLKSDAVLVLKIDRNHQEWVKIQCKNCPRSTVTRHIPVHLEGSCASCDNTTDVKDLVFKWSIHEIKDDSASFYENDTVDCAPRDGTGWLSLVGITGNATDNYTGESGHSQDNMEGFSSVEDKKDGNEEIIQNSGFHGSMVPEDMLNSHHWPKNFKVHTKTHSSTRGGISEGISSERIPELEQESGEDTRTEPHIRRARTTSPQDEEIVDFSTFYNQLPPDPAGSNMRDGYGEEGLRPIGPTQSMYEEAEAGSRFGPSSWDSEPYEDVGETGWGNYRSGVLSFQPDSTGRTNPNNRHVPDTFRTSDPSSNLPIVKHYQDWKHTRLNLSNIAMGKTDQNVLILRPNTLTEGKTYAVTLELSKKDESGEDIHLGKSSYYFSILRGPSYGMCSIFYRKLGDHYSVHCAGWKNQQNDNAGNAVSRNEILNYKISYSLTRDGPERQLSSGPNHEKHFLLPKANKQAYIHINLSNSDGATTRICSFLPKGPFVVGNTTLAPKTPQEYLEEAKMKSLPSMSVLSKMVAQGNQEETIALSNVILDTLPEEENLEDIVTESGETGLLEARSIVSKVILALKSIQPHKLDEIRHVITTLSRALSKSNLVSVKSFLDAAKLFLENVDNLQQIIDREEYRYSIIDEEIVDMLIFARMRLSQTCKQCAKRINSNRNPEEIGEAEEILYGNLTNIDPPKKVSLTSRLVIMEKETYTRLDKFFLKLARQRPKVLGPIHSVIDDYGIVIQPFDSVVTVFNNDKKDSRNSGAWKVGTVLPEYVGNMTKGNSEISQSYVIASTLPDMTLSNYEKNFVEKRHLSFTIFNKTSSEISLHNLNPPVIVALPPRPTEMLKEIKGIVSRDKVTINSFPIHKTPNKTLHIEIVLDTAHQRSFPVTIAITKRIEEQSGPPNEEEIISKQVASRNQFQDFNALNRTITVKFTLQDEDFLHSHRIYYVALWNEQAMTSRSRYYDIDKVAYTLRIWWSDCFYWDDFFMEWRQDGVKVLGKSTSTQTLCSTTHLSSFSASFVPVRTDSSISDIGIAIAHTALSGSITLLCLLLVSTLIILYIHHRILRPRKLETPTSVFRVDYYGSRPRFSEIERRLRWYFGPDHKANSVPVILHDNRKSHKQILEVTVQTSCWPGSGTTSNVNIILYGVVGKYEARELISSKTHSAREARYENGYSENDDYTGIDDELFITGSTQKFIITYPENLGTLWKLIIWHDHSGDCPEWKLDYVTVRDVSSGAKWHFPHYDWLALDRGKKSLSAELRPVYTLPSFYAQVSLKLYSYICNFSSICSLIVSPGSGHLCRRQRAIHLLCLIVTICGLTTARYMLEWDIYSHDADLPYIHGVSISWGLIIGLFASVIVLPAQLLLRFSKHDENISVTIEDATASVSGHEFPNDGESYRYTSLINVAKPLEEYENEVPNTKYTQCHADVCAVPSVEETVCDWLALKAEYEKRQMHVNRVDKDHPLPESQSIVNPQFHRSMNSIDEEIVRCMMTSPACRRSRILNDLASPSHKTISRGIMGEGQQSGTTLLSGPIHGHEGSILSQSQHRRESVSVFHSASYLAEEYAAMDEIYSNGGSTLAMDYPELVPCEKLDPIPQDISALLPKQCKKLAWCYYAIVCICASALSLYGSFTLIRSYDIGPWFECIVFSVVGVLVLIEGGFVIVSAVLTSLSDTIKWFFSEEKLWDLLDRTFSTKSFSNVSEQSIDMYIESSTYYHAPGRDTLQSLHDETLLEDARIARDIADRERSRYLRHVEPPTTPTKGRKKAEKEHMTKKATIEWAQIIFLLTLGIISAVIISHQFDKSNAQSRDIKDWFKRTTSFPTSGGYITTKMYESRNASSNTFQNVKSRKTWMIWFKKVLQNCPKSKSGFTIAKTVALPEDTLLKKVVKPWEGRPKQLARYVLIGPPVLRIRRFKNILDPKIVDKNILSLLNYSIPASEHEQHVEKKSLPEVNAMLSGKTSDGTFKDELGHEDETVFKIPSQTTKTQKIKQNMITIKRLIEKQPTVNSVAVELILYNPYANLYSHIYALTDFYPITGSENSGKSVSPINVKVTSLSLSQAGLDRTKPNTILTSFYACQVLLLCWVSYTFIRAIVLCSSLVVQRYAVSILDHKQIKQSGVKEKILTALLDILILLLVVLGIVFSVSRRSHVEGIMPYIYGYDLSVDDSYETLTFEDIISSSTRLATTYGGLNFLLIIKIFTLMKKYHNFPRFFSSSKTRRYPIGEIFLILFLFWAASVLFAFIGYLIFSDSVSFSSFTSSLSNIMLFSVTLGALPAKSSADLSTLRTKYGTLITVWFLVTVFVTLRLIIRALLIAYYKSKLRKPKSKPDQKEPKEKEVEVTVSFTELFCYNWQKLKYFALCLLCIVLRRDPGMWSAQSDVEFTSLGFSKSKQLTEREKKKLGSSSSQSRKSTPQKMKVEECKGTKNDQTISSVKYKLPSEVWLSEVEAQLDELYSRASTLADIAMNDVLEEEFLKRNIEKAQAQAENIKNKDANIIQVSPARPVTPTNITGKAVPGKSDMTAKESITTGKPPTRRRSTENKAKTIKKIHPKRPNTNKTATPFIAHTQKTETVQNIEQNSQMKQIKAVVKTVSQNIKQGTGFRNSHFVEYTSTGQNDGHRYGWLSDDDTLDRSSDVSGTSASSFAFSYTPVPPLTKHNLARHNYHLTSRQSSPNTKDTKSTGKSVGLSDIPSTSSARYETAPESPDSMSNKIKQTFSSLKRLITREEIPQKQNIKTRPLRRSRTAAINIKDLPSFETMQDSDGASDRTGKKSSASTTKLRGVFHGRKRGARNISNLQADSKVYSSPTNSQSQISDVTSVPSQISGFSLGDYETFSIPGTVCNESAVQISTNSSEKSEKTNASRRRRKISNRSTSEYHGTFLPPRIKEESVENDILSELKRNRRLSHKS